MRKVLFAVLIVAALPTAYLLGRRHAGREANVSAARLVLYYIDPMHPAYKSDKPGIAPDCGMQLVPVYAGDADTAPVASTLASMAPGTVAIDAGMKQLLGIRTATVESSAGNRMIRVVGRIVPEDTRVYKVDSGMEGFVRETYNDAVGELVRKDQKLASYYGQEVLPVASGFLAATERVPGAAGKDGSRTMPFPGAVSKQGVSSIQGYADRLRNLGMSDVQINQIADSGKLPESVDIVAPADGFILSRNISPGLHFERSMEFYRIADLSRIWIIAEVFENEAQNFRPGTVARVTLPGQNKTFLARTSNILPDVDPATRTLKLRLEVENPGFVLRPDMFVDVELPVRAPSGLTVPMDALIDSGMHKRVFIDRGDGVFEPREVETGWQFGDRVQVVKGLTAGERVAAAGTFLLDSESKLRAATAGSTSATTDGTGTAPTTQSPSETHKKMNMRAAFKPIKSEQGVMARDPKCGMLVDSVQASAAGNAVLYRGTTYYFCSRKDKDDFSKNPERYLLGGHEMTSHWGGGHD